MPEPRFGRMFLNIFYRKVVYALQGAEYAGFY
jgi:hypothetical protein